MIAAVRFIRSGVFLTGRTGIYIACGLLTAFLLANSYETTFGQTLPVANAVSKVDLSYFQPNPDFMVPALNSQTSSAYQGTYGTPSQIRIAATAKNITIAAPIYHQHSWLARSSTAHYILVSHAKEGDIGDLIVYMTGSRTTIAKDEVDKIKPSSNIYLYTKRDWRYMYRVNEVATLNDSDASERYVIPQTTGNRMYLVVQDGPAHTIIATTLVNVQSEDQQ
ncbi:MAG TPA: hypothetical protein VFH99_01005 [Candidatus Saccharimonadales bacterium]|nr:hypothetical protein [Candidatus Saccharimonadales bacterium]